MDLEEEDVFVAASWTTVTRRRCTEHSRTTHPLESREHVAEIGRLGPVVAAWAYGAIEHSSTSIAATIPVHVYL